MHNDWKHSVDQLLEQLSLDASASATSGEPATSPAEVGPGDAHPDHVWLTRAADLVEEAPLLTPYRDGVTRLLDQIQQHADEASELALRASLRRVELTLSGAGSATAMAQAERVSKRAASCADTALSQRATLAVARAALVQNQPLRVETLLRSVAKPATPAIAAWSAVVRSMVVLMQMKVDEAKRLLQDALSTVESVDSRVDDLRYFVLLNLGILGGMKGDPVAPLDAALNLMRSHGAVAERIALHGLLGPHFRTRRDFAAAKNHLQQAVDLARQTGMMKEAIGFRLVLARVRLDEGDRPMARVETMGLLDEIEAAGDMSAFFQATELMMDIFIAGEEYAAAYRICQTACQAVVRAIPLAVELLRRKLKLIEERMGAGAYKEMVDQVDTALRATAHLRH
ncbi:MAG: hypothetical protein KC609_13235 [Myxococcales bacterium]|nr:hypothetical protein [Myxococcales bacterium]